MKFLVPPLGLGCESRFRRKDRPFIEYRPFAVNKPDAAICTDQLFERTGCLLTIGAVVVEEFNNGNVSIGVAKHRCIVILKQAFAVRQDR